MNKTGIICAADTELAPFLPHIQNRKTSERAMLKFHEGMINGLEVAAVFCGVGRTNAAIAAQILIDCYGVDMIINAGTAGGMDERLDIFDTVVATESVYHDVHEDILTGFHPWLDSVFLSRTRCCLNCLEILLRSMINQSTKSISAEWLPAKNS